MQPLENAFALTHCFAKMGPCLHAVSQKRVRTHMSQEHICAYIQCRENMSAVRAPFILDPSGPTDYSASAAASEQEKS